MNELPANWVRARLGDVATWGSGGTPKAGDPRYYGGDIPWAVIGDLTDGFVTSTKTTITREGLESSSAKLIPPNSVLVAMYGSIGKLGINTIPLTSNQAIAFAQPHTGAMEAQYLFYYLLSQRAGLTSAGKGATQKNISQTLIRSWGIPLPPLAEQRRIVAALEDHLSRLDAADAGVSGVARRLKLLTKRVLVEAVPLPGPRHWKLVPVAEAGRVELGRARHPDWHTGPHMRPYLRVANVFEDRIDTSDLMEMNFPPETFERYRLTENDILLNEGQSPEYLGRPAMYRGSPEDVAFTNSLLRFRAGPDVLPEWALLVFRRHMHAGRFIRELRITTNIAHLSATRLKTVEFPIPPLDEQERIVTEVREKLDSIRRFADAVEASSKRARGLRKSLLAEAFAGRLVEQDPADEPASVLLERIQAERAAQGPVRRGRGKRAPQKEALL